ncbi:hypothetical protein Aph02nite_84720 [Actinoplanes philippinensis]|uniref:Uncharacterized protein n=1 Tax=Actinoplanes philippinensis TaxID=35752 RepID=A0A1I2EQZ6_9ACTN|nr:hypothetical protein [Actinoplanes philippinensis]GIE82522.1 hypothetical protein Aph02nite_84720 [Actinoplanes philippinensis]SFE94640.1 hypothetical protein SAMN05421541_104623 [Actinoplanes philippinensis]
MGTFGSWLSGQTAADDPVGRFAQHTMHRHGDECGTCRAKEDGEELTWGVAEVVRDMDGHFAHDEFYEMLDESVSAWALARRGA